MDLLIAPVSLILALPVLVLLMVVVRIDTKAASVFPQDRLGLKGSIFTVYKLHTMTDAVDEGGQPLPDSERPTRIGRLLRRTSFDELRGLFNVLSGDMSLVAPRPLLVRYRDRYSADQMRRHDVRPGITGLAQVKGRNRLDWNQQLELTFGMLIMSSLHWTYGSSCRP